MNLGLLRQELSTCRDLHILNIGIEYKKIIKNKNMIEVGTEVGQTQKGIENWGEQITRPGILVRSFVKFNRNSSNSENSIKIGFDYVVGVTLYNKKGEIADSTILYYNEGEIEPIKPIEKTSDKLNKLIIKINEKTKVQRRRQSIDKK